MIVTARPADGQGRRSRIGQKSLWKAHHGREPVRYGSQRHELFGPRIPVKGLAMADRSRVKPANERAYSDRAEKRLWEPEPGMSRWTGHGLQYIGTSIALSLVGLTGLDDLAARITVLTASGLGSLVVGKAYERYGERRGLREGFEAGRRQGRAEALREMQERSLRSRFLPGRAHPGNRDRSGR